MMEEPLNVDQAARFLGLKKGTIYNMVSRRVIPHHKIGSRVLFTQAELKNWFESTSVPCVASPSKSGKKKRQESVDAREIVKNAVEQFTRT
jgi:excisionase family DNA binding protein